MERKRGKGDIRGLVDLCKYVYTLMTNSMF